MRDPSEFWEKWPHPAEGRGQIHFVCGFAQWNNRHRVEWSKTGASWLKQPGMQDILYSLEIWRWIVDLQLFVSILYLLFLSPSLMQAPRFSLHEDICGVCVCVCLGCGAWNRNPPFDIVPSLLSLCSWWSPSVSLSITLPWNQPLCPLKLSTCPKALSLGSLFQGSFHFIAMLMSVHLHRGTIKPIGQLC